MLEAVLDYLGCAKAGRKGWPIVFVDCIVEEEQNEMGEASFKIPRFLKYYTVFN